MKSALKKLGNVPAVAIPTVVLEATKVEIGQEVDVRAEAGRIIIEPMRRRPRYSLRELVSRCDSKKRLSRGVRAWIDDPPVGRESL